MQLLSSDPGKTNLISFLNLSHTKIFVVFYLFIRISIHVLHKQIMKYTKCTPGGTYTSSMLEVFWICIQIRLSKISQLYSTKVWVTYTCIKYIFLILDNLICIQIQNFFKAILGVYFWVYIKYNTFKYRYMLIL